MYEDLKPCPHCNGTNLNIIQTSMTCRVVCCTKGCWLAGPMKERKDSAVSAWNNLPRILKWTKSSPSVNGWYWLRQKKTHGHVQIIRACGEELPENWDNAEWAGPISYPTDIQ